MRRRAVGCLAFTLLCSGALGAQSSPTPRHTDADKHFVHGMISHHSQAVLMAALVPTRTSREDLTMLARRIDVSQVDEIAWMNQWLLARGEDTVAAMTMRMPMPGMLSADEMSMLERSTGEDFERLFLIGMIKHHEGALVMVKELFASPGAAQESAIFGFASDVDADQRAEITRMRLLLDRLGPAIRR